jgi:amidase
MEFASTVDETTASKAKDMLRRATERMEALAKPGTILALPTAPAIAPRIDMGNEDYEKFRARTVRMTCMASISGLPQINIPAGTVAGCPAGLSFIGWRGGDEALLDLAMKVSGYCGIET